MGNDSTKVGKWYGIGVQADVFHHGMHIGFLSTYDFATYRASVLGADMKPLDAQHEFAGHEYSEAIAWMVSVWERHMSNTLPVSA